MYRSMLRNSSKITNYNFRAHAMRRIKAGFRSDLNTEESLLTQKYNHGLQQLEIVKRQSLISQLFPDTMKSVMQASKT